MEFVFIARQEMSNYAPLQHGQVYLHLTVVSRACRKSWGADYVVNSIKSQDIKSEVFRMTDGQGVNVVIDCVGAEETIRDSIRILSKGSVLVVVGLFGNQIKMPLVQSVINEYQVRCSLWGNYNELREVIELAKQHKIKHSIHRFSLNDVKGNRFTQIRND